MFLTIFNFRKKSFSCHIFEADGRLKLNFEKSFESSDNQYLFNIIN